MKTQDDFLKALRILAHRCEYQMEEVEVRIYVKHLEPLGWNAVLAGMEKIYLGLKGGSRTLMPSVNDVKEAAGAAPLSDRSQGSEIASRLLAGVAKYGTQRNRSQDGGDWRARAWVGELGWIVVERMFGGWEPFCALCTSDNYGTMFAQIRDESAGICERARKGQLHLPPALDQVGVLLPEVEALARALPAVKSETN